MPHGNATVILRPSVTDEVLRFDHLARFTGMAVLRLHDKIVRKTGAAGDEMWRGNRVTRLRGALTRDRKTTVAYDEDLAERAPGLRSGSAA